MGRYMGYIGMYKVAYDTGLDTGHQMSQGAENILPAPAGNRTQAAGSTGKHSTTSL